MLLRTDAPVLRSAPFSASPNLLFFDAWFTPSNGTSSANGRPGRSRVSTLGGFDLQGAGDQMLAAVVSFPSIARLRPSVIGSLLVVHRGTILWKNPARLRSYLRHPAKLPTGKRTSGRIKGVARWTHVLPRIDAT